MEKKCCYLFGIAAGLIVGSFMTCANVYGIFADAAIKNKGLDIYYVRHAESVGNRTGDYSGDNQRLFTPEGEKARKTLVEALAPYHFDHILVSPLYRARQTILPYLQASGQMAELWPELAECYWERGSDITDPDDLEHGDEIMLEEEHVPFFAFRPDGHYFIGRYNAPDGAALVKSAVDLLLERYGQSGKTLLLVGHFYAGRGLIETLLGYKDDDPSISLENTTVSHLRQLPDGTFKLLMLNNESREYSAVGVGKNFVRTGKPSVGLTAAGFCPGPL